MSQTDSYTRNLTVNASSPMLSDVRVRQALEYAIDKVALSHGLTGGYEDPVYHLFVDGIPYTNVDVGPNRTYDIDKAVDLPEEAGWMLNSAGQRKKDGVVLSLRFTYDSAIAMNKLIALFVQSQLTAIGIEVETVGEDIYIWWDDGIQGNYDITIWNTEQAHTSPHNFFTPMPASTPHTPA